MDFQAEQQLQSQLSSGERLLWTGRPRQGLRLVGSDLFLIPFSLLWCGFALFWEYQVISSGGPFLMKIWGLPFIVVGLYIVFGRFFVDSHIRSRTYYGLTDRRILILTGFSKLELKSFDVRTLPELSLSRSSNGKGTIWLGSNFAISSRTLTNASWPGGNRNAVPCLDTIDDVESVYHQILDLQKTAQTTSTW